MKPLKKIISNVVRHPRFLDNPFKVSCRILFFQVWKKFNKKPWIFIMPTKTRMAAYPGQYGSTSFYYFGYPDPQEQFFVIHITKPGELFVDIGANTGGWTLMMAGAGARVIACEPVPVTFSYLMKNIALNPEVGNSIQPVQKEIGNQPGRLKFTADLDTGNHMIGDNSGYRGKTCEVEVITLDDLLYQKDPKIIKIDVEGSELEVIRGGRKILGNPSLKALIIETFRKAHYRDKRLQELENILADFGFVPVQYDHNNRRTIPLNAGEGGQNTIYYRK